MILDYRWGRTMGDQFEGKMDEENTIRSLYVRQPSAYKRYIEEKVGERRERKTRPQVMLLLVSQLSCVFLQPLRIHPSPVPESYRVVSYHLPHCDRIEYLWKEFSIYLFILVSMFNNHTADVPSSHRLGTCSTSYHERKPARDRSDRSIST